MFMKELSQKYFTPQFDVNTDPSTTFLDMENMTMSDKIKAEERFQISDKGYTIVNYLMV